MTRDVYAAVVSGESSSRKAHLRGGDDFAEIVGDQVLQGDDGLGRRQAYRPSVRVGNKGDLVVALVSSADRQIHLGLPIACR